MVSVICVSYNDLHHLKRLFSSLEEQTFQNFEVIIVDNARNDSVAQYVNSLAASGNRRIVYVPNVNNGYPGGNVKGVKYAKGDLILISNPDIVLEGNALKTLVNAFSNQTGDVMVLVPKVLIRQSNLINSIGMRKIRPSENIYTNIGYSQYDTGQFDQPRKVEAFDGSAFIFRRPLLDYTYLFDTRFFFGNETVDLAERMTKLGFSSYTCPRAVVHHELRGSVTSSKQNDKITAIIVRNSLIHTFRNTNRSMFLRTLVIGVCLRNILGRIITRQSPRTGIIYLRGLAMFVTQIGKFIATPLAFNQDSRSLDP